MWGRLQEAVAARYAQDGLSVVTVNPTRVFGPGHLTEGNALTSIIDLYDRGRLARAGGARLTFIRGVSDFCVSGQSVSEVDFAREQG